MYLKTPKTIFLVKVTKLTPQSRQKIAEHTAIIKRCMGMIDTSSDDRKKKRFTAKIPIYEPVRSNPKSHAPKSNLSAISTIHANADFIEPESNDTSDDEESFIASKQRQDKFEELENRVNVFVNDYSESEPDEFRKEFVKTFSNEWQVNAEVRDKHKELLLHIDGEYWLTFVTHSGVQFDWDSFRSHDIDRVVQVCHVGQHSIIVSWLHPMNFGTGCSSATTTFCVSPNEIYKSLIRQVRCGVAPSVERYETTALYSQISNYLAPMRHIPSLLMQIEVCFTQTISLFLIPMRMFSVEYHNPHITVFINEIHHQIVFIGTQSLLWR